MLFIYIFFVSQDTLNLIKNGQFFDLGLSTTDYHRSNIIRQAIQELYDKFSLVLIYEHLDESLVLMKRKLCWQLDDILYLSFQHTAENSWNNANTSDELKQRMRKWNNADMRLYQFFNKTLWTEISYEGQGFWSDLRDFRRMQQSIENECVSDANDVDVNKQRKTQQQVSKNVMKAFQGENLFGSGEDQIQKNTFKEDVISLKILNKGKINKNEGHLLTDTVTDEQETDTSSGDIRGENNDINLQIDPKLQTSKHFSSWNEHFCRKLLLDEEQYLDYFRRKHAYAKSSMRHQ